VRRRHAQLGLSGVLATLVVFGLQVGAAWPDGAPPIGVGGQLTAAIQGAKLEFWPQRFAADRPLLSLLSLPLLRDRELKQFKGLYFQKLGQGMDMAEVDRAMEAAFARYDRTRDRGQLMRALRDLEARLRAYQPPPYAEEQFVYVAMGASISQGGGASPASRGWVYLVHKRLRSLFPAARVRNLAVGGTTTRHAREVQLPEALRCHPDVVTYTAGMNDLQYGVAAAEVRRNVDFVLVQLRAKTRAKIVMTLMPPGYRFPAFRLTLPKLRDRKRNVRPERVAQFNGVFRDLAARHGVQLVDIGSFLVHANSQAEVDALFSFDGVHPNNAGHAKIADIFWSGIRKALKPVSE